MDLTNVFASNILVTNLKVMIFDYFSLLLIIMVTVVVNNVLQFFQAVESLKDSMKFIHDFKNFKLTNLV